MNIRNRITHFGLAAVIGCGMFACTQPRETTGIGAATGGAIGAGLGAIVGNQVGNPGKGLVVGAVAGGAAGALIGNAFQAQEETMRTQDEAIERQEHMITAQRSQLDELRRLNQDQSTLAAPGYNQGSTSPAYRTQPRAGGYPNVPGQPVLKLKPPFSEQRHTDSAALGSSGRDSYAAPGHVAMAAPLRSQGLPTRSALSPSGGSALAEKSAPLAERQVAANGFGTHAPAVVPPAPRIAPPPAPRVKPELPSLPDEESIVGGPSSAPIKETDLVVGHESAAGRTFDDMDNAGSETRPQPPARVSQHAKGDADNDSFARGSLGWDDSGASGAGPTSAAALNKVNGSAECVKAEEETAKITANTDAADKLFHYRRALRLCPDNAGYHNGLGEVYLGLNRKSDAEFEFREALRVDPSNAQALRNLDSAKGK